MSLSLLPGPSSDGFDYSFWGALLKIVPLGLAFFLNEGTAYAGEVTFNTPGPIGPLGGAINDVLYGLVNGIGNPYTDPNYAPDNIGNLQQDLYSKSDHEVNPNKDTIISALYHASINLPLIGSAINGVANQIIDAINWIKEIQRKYVQSALAAKVIRDFEI